MSEEKIHPQPGATTADESAKQPELTIDQEKYMGDHNYSDSQKDATSSPKWSYSYVGVQKFLNGMFFPHSLITYVSIYRCRHCMYMCDIRCVCPEINSPKRMYTFVFFYVNAKHILAYFIIANTSRSKIKRQKPFLCA